MQLTFIIALFRLKAVFKFFVIFFFLGDNLQFNGHINMTELGARVGGAIVPC